ncbi:MAG TPA: MBOAT family O-acyltransferase [Verrucomicrobiae bacterium]|nr:MBOAT family O-acyltransferase [Verrucomicrobiae bacterium]
MLFNSIHYLFFLPIVVGLYYLVPQKWRWLLLLVASYYFYMCWKAEYAILLLFSTGVAYAAGLGISRTEDEQAKKKYLWSCIAVLLGVLFSFKYFNFASASLRGLCADLSIPLDIPVSHLLLPIGISFYTFQKISYVVDVYHGKVKAEKHFGVFAVYSCFFPQLVAGPIERAQHLLPQFFKRHDFSYDLFASGLRLILWGLFKKIVVADRLAILVNAVYDNPHSYPGLPLVVATVFFGIQIYCDFSGYTDIAIGSGRLLGFDLMANFRQPYYAKSIPEFWHRWHISLSTWFRDYLYIPLGGSRVVKWRWYYNLFITFFISGLWHGANWTFAVWGALHGCFMVLDSLFGPARDWLRSKLKGQIVVAGFDGLNIALTFALVTLAWIPFRAANFSDVWFIFTHMFSGAGDWLDLNTVALQFRGMGLKLPYLIYAGVFAGLVFLYDIIDSRQGVWESLKFSPRPLRWAVYYAILVLVLFFGHYNQAQNFIYFQF